MGFFIDLILLASLWLEATQPLNSYDYQFFFWMGKGGRCVGLTSLSPSCTECIDISGSSTSWSPKALSRPLKGLLIFS